MFQGCRLSIVPLPRDAWPNWFKIDLVDFQNSHVAGVSGGGVACA